MIRKSLLAALLPMASVMSLTSPASAAGADDSELGTDACDTLAEQTLDLRLHGLWL